MGVRIADYQMYLSGERLESFTGIFGWFTGPITSFVGLIIPLFLLKFGFNSNWEVLFVDDSRRNIIVIPIIVDVIGFALMTIPYLFWDYNNKQHLYAMDVLKQREELAKEGYFPMLECYEEGGYEAGSSNFKAGVAELIIDATHPYAVLASQNIRQCCDALNIAYERVHFEDIENAWRDAVEWCDSHDKIRTALAREKGNILLGIGRDPLLPMAADMDMTRLYPRITPTPEAVSACLEAGFLKGNIIAMDGPFSKTLTMALFDDKKITAVVVRDATDKSYLHEMVVPALERGDHVIMYGKK